jgi:AAA15 family ATPase/GTPase
MSDSDKQYRSVLENSHVSRLEILQFKSIRAVEIRPKKINIFIGEPNSGKSNILEALSLFSHGCLHHSNIRSIRDFVRFRHPVDLFHRNDISNSIHISTDILSFEMNYGKFEENGAFSYALRIKHSPDHQKALAIEVKEGESNLELTGVLLDQDGNVKVETESNYITPFKSFNFRNIDIFSQQFLNYPNPPFGENLPQLILSHPGLKEQIADLLWTKGYKLVLKPLENELEIAREIDNILISHPYSTLSETLKRIIFYYAVLETCEHSVISLDEPEANTFPFYTKEFAERIALDPTNQFFITTHNPYLLMSVIEKSKIEDLNIYFTYTENFETKVKALNTNEIVELFDLGSDAFFNLDKFRIE